MAPVTYEELKVKYYHPRCHKKLSLRHPSHDFPATLRYLSEQPFNFTMHYNGHRESTYVTIDVTHFFAEFTYEKLKVK